MRYRNVSIAALGRELPPLVLTSAELEERLGPVYRRLGLPEGRLELMSGIRERRFWPDGVLPSEVASRAGADALSRSNIPRESVGCLIHASVCRDFLEPATANVVHDRLRLPRDCQVFDVSNACLGVVTGVTMVANMIELGQIEAGLVVAGENGKPLVDSTIAALLGDPTLTRRSIKGSFASLTIGSGAAAVLVARTGLVPEGRRLRGAVVRAATEHHRLCQGGASPAAREAGSVGDTGVGAGGALLMSTSSEELLTAGVSLARETFSLFLDELGWPAGSLDRILSHQVGRAHQRALFEALALPEERGYVTYDRLGNVGSVSLPISLALAADAGFVAPGHRVALLGIGSGLSTVMMGVEW